MTKNGDFLRLLIPVAGFTPDQRNPATALANRVEAKVGGMLARGADPDRLMEAVEGYFPGE
jgi:hypothetical protein